MSRKAEVHDLEVALYGRDQRDRVRRVSEQLEGVTMIEAIAILSFALEQTW